MDLEPETWRSIASGYAPPADATAPADATPDNVIEIDDHRPHGVHEVMCWWCGHEMVVVSLVGTPDIACTQCGVGPIKLGWDP